MVTKFSHIKDKDKLIKYLYKNPEKLALKLAKFTKDDDGYSLPMVKIKGEGQGYYYSMNHKKLIRVVRNGEFYLLPWADPKDKRKCYIYCHYNWMVGCIFNVYKDDLEHLGAN
mgnify:CR=1 FL=1